MILLLAVAGGLPAGVAWSWWRREAYQPPEMRAVWLACLAFLPQTVSAHAPNSLAKACLLLSLLAFFVFTWLNRRPAGMQILLAGLLLNLIVIASNGGFMPISPRTASGCHLPRTVKVRAASRSGRFQYWISRSSIAPEARRRCDC